MKFVWVDGLRLRLSSPWSLIQSILASMHNCTYYIKMTYQWDRDKAAANLRKHGIDVADAVSVFSDDLALTIPGERFDEERFVTIGLDGFGRVLVVVYTLRGEAIRIISARKASKQERRQYEEG